ncbi:hypothetical protein O4J56_15675 [Nocardiopsis sp. RSe5-2]|uniref:ATP-binding protein n=1 Tax=Nocardiopsis endophytica TaxID=3018445 RepID=A0ABT4U556_9ACTN|nr:hypothetical protein [Nocardiopsis endophytica]MDA2812083.1 hypothetical protein [Nocardiopsis endophytica]
MAEDNDQHPQQPPPEPDSPEGAPAAGAGDSPAPPSPYRAEPTEDPNAGGGADGERPPDPEEEELKAFAFSEQKRRDSRYARTSGKSFKVKKGDMTFGDHYGDRFTYYNVFTQRDGSSARMGAVDKVGTALAVRVTTASDTELARRLKRDRIVLLRGPEGSGRTTSAVCELARQGAPTPERPIRTVPASTGLGALDAMLRDPDDEACGYVLDASGAPWLADAAAAELSALSSTLDRHDARLCVLVDRDATVRHLQWTPVEHTPVDLRGVLERTLAAALLTRGTAPTENRDAVDAAVTRRARPVLEEAEKRSSAARTWAETADTPEDAAALGNLLATLADPGDALPEDTDRRVGEVRARRLADRARALLRGTSRRRSPVDQAYVIATAVLDGCSLAKVITAAEDLAARLHQAERPNGPWRREAFSLPLNHRLRHVDLVAAADGGGSGDTAGSPGDAAVRLRQPDLWAAVVDQVWIDHEAARRPLLEWLARLCETSEEGDTGVQNGVELTLARLATEDFDEITRTVLEPWARRRPAFSTGGAGSAAFTHCRRVAAWVLERLVVETRQEPRALRLLDRWMRSNDIPLRRTAVLAYGSRVACRVPGTVFATIRNELDRIAENTRRGIDSVGTLMRTMLVVEALQGAYDAGMRDGAVSLIAREADAARPGASKAALIALMHICRLRERPPGAEAGAARGPHPDLLTWLDAPWPDPPSDSSAPARTSDRPDPSELLAGIARLWAAALLDDIHGPTAWRILLQWDTAAGPAAGDGAAVTAPGRRARMDELLAHLRRVPDLHDLIDRYERVRARTAHTRRPRRGPDASPGEEAADGPA